MGQQDGLFEPQRELFPEEEPQASLRGTLPHPEEADVLSPKQGTEGEVWREVYAYPGTMRSRWSGDGTRDSRSARSSSATGRSSSSTSRGSREKRLPVLQFMSESTLPRCALSS